MSDTYIYGPTFVPKKGLFFTYLGQSLSQQADFLLLFGPILQADFLENVVSFKQEIHLRPCL